MNFIEKQAAFKLLSTAYEVLGDEGGFHEVSMAGSLLVPFSSRRAARKKSIIQSHSKDTSYRASGGFPFTKAREQIGCEHAVVYPGVGQ